MVEIQFRACVLRIWPADLYQETVFEGIGKVPALCVFNPAAYEIAERLGYGSDREAVINCWRAHDPLHTILAEERGEPFSPTLYGVALHDAGRGKYAARHIWAEEEARVLAMQAHAHDRIMRPELEGLDLERILEQLAVIKDALR